MQLQTTKDDLTIKLSQLKTELTDIKTKFTQSKLKITETTSQLMDHYKQLLYEGLDVRTEGLTWIIKAMWNLGEDVPIEFFPSFLDFNAVDYLFTVAHKSIEINKLNEKINTIKRGLRESMLLSQDNNVIESKRTEKVESSSSKTDEFFRTSIFPIKNKRMLKALSMSNIYIPQKKEKNNNELTIKQINLMIQNSKKKLNDNVLSYVDKLEELNLQKKNIELELINLKNNEMNRIFKEFMENDYQRRFDVVIEVVDGALTEWETDVFITYENLAKEMQVSYNADDIKTRLTVTYGEYTFENYTLTVEPKAGNNYPEYPNPGAVNINKEIIYT